MPLRPALLRTARRLLGRLADERGFTLTELLTVMAILGTVVGSFVTVFVSASKAEVDMNRRFQAQQEARLALDQLRREGHCASALTMPAAAPTNRITLTFGPYCRGGADIAARTTISLGLTSTATTFAVGAISGSFPAVPFNVQVNNEIMRVYEVAGSTWKVQSRGLLGTSQAAHAADAPVRLGHYATTWCTTGSGSRFALRRIEGDAPGCAGGKVVADFLTQGNVFAGFTAQSETRRAALSVSFVVDVDPQNAMGVYRLQDDIVLRNTSRSS